MLFRDTLLTTLAKLLPGIVGIATTAVLTRLLEPHQFGEYGFILVLMAFISTVGFDWLGVTFLRMYHVHRDANHTIATFAAFFAGLVATSTALMVGYWVALDFETSRVAPYFLGLCLAWCLAAFELISKYEIANLHSLRNLKINVVRSVLVFLGAVGAAWVTHSPMLTAVGMGVGLMAGSAFAVSSISVPGSLAIDKDLTLRIAKFGIPLALGFVFSGLLTSGTRLMVAALGSAAALGYYTAAYALVQNSLVVFGSGISAVTFQQSVRAVESDDVQTFGRKMLDGATLLLMALAPMAVGIAITAKDLAHVLVGGKFEVVVAQLMPWMAAGALVQAFQAGYLDYAFHLGYRSDLLAWVAAIAVVVAFALGIYFIPHLGALGAAISMTTSSVFSAVLAAIVGRRAYFIPRPIGGASRIAGACLAMAVAVIAIPGSGTVHLLIEVFAGGMVYSFAAVLLNVLGLRNRALLLLRSQLVRLRQG